MPATRREYRLAAEQFRTTFPTYKISTTVSQWKRDVAAMAWVFQQTNEKFNREKFLKECGWDD